MRLRKEGGTVSETEGREREVDKRVVEGEGELHEV